MFPLHVGVAGTGPHWLTWFVQLDVIFICVLLVYGYAYVVSKLRWRLPEAGRVPGRQQFLFYSGVVALWVATGSPVHNLADDYLVSAHMLQHILIMLVASPLLLAGVPGWFWGALIRSPRSLAIVRRITHPLVTLSFFNAVFLFTHLPEAVNLQIDEWWFHLGVHTLQLVAGIGLWWPVLNNCPELPRMSYPLQMGYLFVQSLIPSVFAGIFTFSRGSVYSAYTHFDRVWGMTIVEDQQLAGAVMKIFGSLILWAFIGVAFFKWYAREEAEARGLPWAEVEQELHEMGVAPHR